MAFKVNGGWVSFNGHNVGTGETKGLATAIATVRSRYHKPLEMVGVAALLALSLMGCKPDANSSVLLNVQEASCTPTLQRMDPHTKLRCEIFGKTQKAEVTK